MSSISGPASIPLEIPRCSPGIGSLILAPESDDLIQGVRVAPYPLWPDDRGYFLEVMRTARGLPRDFNLESTQVSFAHSYPGSIKAFHYHRQQTDLWVPAAGMLQVALVDLRRDSATYAVKNTLYVGALRSWQILIPPGVAHGYKVIGRDPASLVYVTDRFYNPEDEGRIPYNHESIAYDWETQHK